MFSLCLNIYNNTLNVWAESTQEHKKFLKVSSKKGELLL